MSSQDAGINKIRIFVQDFEKFILLTIKMLIFLKFVVEKTILIDIFFIFSGGKFHQLISHKINWWDGAPI